ncbi:MAG TPA: argininosuccinate lyase [Candidatus Thermoplasmatota archaeon]|nr:argininosuccinate lyase [Candidatus Thermoplasmatota archaeon]
MTTNQAWGGRFSGGTDPLMAGFSSSLSEDRLLVRDDVLGSLAHVRALRRAGLLTDAEAAELSGGLRAVLADLVEGRAHLVEQHEDVHMNVEVLLAARTPLAARLHTGRSRNDQVALDLRLWTRRHALALASALLRLEDALLAQAEAQADVLLPGYTHLQRAQTVTLGHHLHAHALRVHRDAGRAVAAFDAANVSPLGAGALAGSTLGLDPLATAADLGMEPFANSLDAVSDRDFALDATYAAAVAGLHLSSLGEELVLWTTKEFAFVELPEGFTTGSSLMPQKRNPDAAELLRGRAGPLLGHLVALASTLKGLPLSYNRDLQEAKAPLLRSLPSAVEAVRVAEAVVRGLRPRVDRMAASLADGFLEATDLAEALVRRGEPFREAHHAVGRLVALAESRGTTLAGLSDADARSVVPQWDAKLRAACDPARGASLRSAPGGPAPDSVRRAVAAARGETKTLEAAIAERARLVEKAESMLEVTP